MLFSFFDDTDFFQFPNKAFFNNKKKQNKVKIKQNLKFQTK